MIEVTETAAKKINEYYEANKVEMPLRVAAMQGCSGPSLGLALDDKKDNDAVSEITGGITVLVDNDLLTHCGGIKVDFIEASSCSTGGCGGGGGFAVTSTNPLADAGSGCGGSCSSGCGC